MHFDLMSGVFLSAAALAGAVAVGYPAVDPEISTGVRKWVFWVGIIVAVVLLICAGIVASIPPKSLKDSAQPVVKKSPEARLSSSHASEVLPRVPNSQSVTVSAVPADDVPVMSIDITSDSGLYFTNPSIGTIYQYTDRITPGYSIESIRTTEGYTVSACDGNPLSAEPSKIKFQRKLYCNKYVAPLSKTFPREDILSFWIKAPALQALIKAPPIIFIKMKIDGVTIEREIDTQIQHKSVLENTINGSLPVKSTPAPQ